MCEHSTRSGVDPFPSLNREAVERIEAGLKQNYRTAAPTILAESWQRLKPILATYREDAEFLRRFLNKGQASLLQGISKRSEKLLADLTKAKDQGLGLLVESAVAPLTVEAFEETLRSMVDELSIEPRDGPFLKDVSREHLYQNFVIWWRRATGEAPWIMEGQAGKPPPTPFMFVANEVFNLPGMPGPTGASYASLMGLQRSLREREEKTRRLREVLIPLGRQDLPDNEG